MAYMNYALLRKPLLTSHHGSSKTIAAHDFGVCAPIISKWF
jgi:hypothetical protein